MLMPDTSQSSSRTYLWTFAAGLLYAASTFAMLMVIVHVSGAYWGGVFSLALAVVQQLLTIGCFSVRTYQVSDVREIFTFGDYLSSRVLTCLLMVVAGLVWLGFSGYSKHQTHAVLLLLLLKTAEAFANVLEGRYQQSDRLDTACRCAFWKTLIPLLFFMVSIILTRQLLASLAIYAGLYIVLTLAFDGQLVGAFGGLAFRWNQARQGALFRACLPLFVNAFLLTYITNAAKYAVHTQKGAARLSIYSAMFMFAYAIPMLSMFLLTPRMTNLARAWHAKSRRAFAVGIAWQILLIAVLTLAGVAAAYGWGAAILTRLFGLDLMPFRREICLLTIGGAGLAAYQVLQYALTVMRHLAACLGGIVVAAAAALVCTPPLVARYGITGAVWSFFSVSSFLAAIFLGLTLFGLLQASRTAKRA